MKRKDITPGKVYSLLSYRDSRQGWPVMILSKDSYQKHHRTHVVDIAGNDRLVQGDYLRSAVGLIVVKLGFSMTEPTGPDGDGPMMDVRDFHRKVAVLRERASVVKGLAALNDSRDRAWDDREHLNIRDQDGILLGHYELLTGLQMVQGPYVELTLAERQAEAQRTRYGQEAEQARVADVATYRSLAARLDALGITGYHCGDRESPHGRFEKLTFEDMDTLVSLAEDGALMRSKE